MAMVQEVMLRARVAELEETKRAGAVRRAAPRMVQAAPARVALEGRPVPAARLVEAAVIRAGPIPAEEADGSRRAPMVRRLGKPASAVRIRTAV